MGHEGKDSRVVQKLLLRHERLKENVGEIGLGNDVVTCANFLETDDDSDFGGLFSKCHNVIDTFV